MPWHVRPQQDRYMPMLGCGHATACPYRGDYCGLVTFSAAMVSRVFSTIWAGVARV